MCLLGREAQCRTALTDWLLKYGEQTYYDRLSRALQHIGRTDIAVGEKQTERGCLLRSSELCLHRIALCGNAMAFKLNYLFSMYSTVLLIAANLMSRHHSMSMNRVP